MARKDVCVAAQGVHVSTAQQEGHENPPQNKKTKGGVGVQLSGGVLARHV